MEQKIDYDSFMKNYKEQHQCCPNCGETSNFNSTLMGFIFDSSKPDEYKDLNRCKCDCGNVHKYHDRISILEFKNKTTNILGYSSS